MNIYVASSWRNKYQPEIVTYLRSLGHVVYDFRNPAPDDHGFGWKQVALKPSTEWSLKDYREALQHPTAQKGFKLDFDAMKAADACVLVLPCGRSAHLEAGWFSGQHKPLVILLHEDQFTPELMYLVTPYICTDLDEVKRALEAAQAFNEERCSDKGDDPDYAGY